MKKILSIILGSFLLVNAGVFADDEMECPGIETTGEHGEKICRMVYNACAGGVEALGGYKITDYFDEDVRLVTSPEMYQSPETYESDFLGIEAPFLEAQATYKGNMSRIYECATVRTKLDTKKEIAVLLENFPVLKHAILPVYEREITRLERTAQECVLPEELTQDHRENVLNEATYEMCKYTVYLHYLHNEYYVQLDNITDTSEEVPEYREGDIEEILDQMLPLPPEGSTRYVLAVQNRARLESMIRQGREEAKNNGTYRELGENREKMNKMIYDELEHTADVFRLSFRAFSDFETYYPVHGYLDLIKRELIIYREKLYKTLWPLNQLTFKIINAMSR